MFVKATEICLQQVMMIRISIFLIDAKRRLFKPLRISIPVRNILMAVVDNNDQAF
jgi:hypothetical protein